MEESGEMYEPNQESSANAKEIANGNILTILNESKGYLAIVLSPEEGAATRICVSTHGLNGKALVEILSVLPQVVRNVAKEVIGCLKKGR